MTAQLDYAPTIRWYRRSRVRRWAVVAGILAVFGVAAYFVGPPVYARGRFLYWQNQCMNAPMGARVKFSVGAPIPQGFEVMLEHLPKGKEIANLFGPYDRPVFAFTQKRRTAAGERLVVGWFSDTMQNRGCLAYDTRCLNMVVIEPGTISREPRVLSENVFRHLGSLEYPWPYVDFSFQTDPNDESRLVLTLEMQAGYYDWPGPHYHRYNYRLNADDKVEKLEEWKILP